MSRSHLYVTFFVFLAVVALGATHTQTNRDLLAVVVYGIVSVYSCDFSSIESWPLEHPELCLNLFGHYTQPHLHNRNHFTMARVDSIKPSAVNKPFLMASSSIGAQTEPISNRLVG